MRSTVFLAVLTVAPFSPSLFADMLDCAPEYGWTGTAGAADEDQARGLAVDSDGNILICGTFDETMDFDPTDGEDFRSPIDFGDIFITKLGPDGSYHWTAVMGGDSYGFAMAVTVDSQDNILVGGSFLGTVDFDPGTGEDNRTAQAVIDGFVTKLGPDGSYQWTWTFAGAPFSASVSQVRDLAVDPNDHIVVTGDFSEAVDFDPGEGEDIHASTGGTDVFVSKLAPNGAYHWTLTFGSDVSEVGTSVATDADGNILLAGNFGGGADPGILIDLDPTEGEDWHAGFGRDDIYVSKFEADGTYAWGATIGATGEQQALDVKTDCDGNVYLTGRFRETVDFDPTDGEDLHTSMQGWWCSCPSRDVYLTKLAPDGSYRWTTIIGDDTDDEPGGIAIGDDGDIVIVGRFGGQMDFDPTEGEDWHTAVNGKDVFVVAIGHDESYGWGVTMGGPGKTYGEAIAIDSLGDIVVSGSFENTVDFDPTDGVDERTSAGHSDYFVTKLLCSDLLPCEGDANGDGTVDPLDAGFVLSRFGCAVGAGDVNCDTADMNGDGLVDPLDAGFILARFGDCQ